MTTGIIGRTLRSLGARDPARERLRKTLWVTAGILLSVLWGYGVIHVTHAEPGLLSISVFLSMMSGAFVRDATAPARVTTAALLIPTLVVVPVVGTLLHPYRPLVLVLFVVIAGLAVWVRRFGPRATTIGTVSFFAYFFTLFMHPDVHTLPAFVLIAAGAAATQFLMKMFQWFGRHPERELGVMLAELRVATAAALETASTPGHERSLPSRFDRVDTLWRAITGWQSDFRTAAFTDRTAEALAVGVLDACVHSEEACREVARCGAVDPDHTEALSHARAVLAERPPADRLDLALRWAQTMVSEADVLGTPTAGDDDLCDYRLAECILAHLNLRAIRLHPRSLPPSGHDTAARETADAGTVSAPENASSGASSDSPDLPGTAPEPPSGEPGARHGIGRPHWTPWRDWAPTSRLAVQAMTATALASLVGEAISASRWYWAVLTAFLVFFSATTRSGILTRAYRRVIGTVLGLITGIVLTFLVHDAQAALVAMCLLCIMGMLYFAPLNYLYASFFITTMLVALYDLLGVLHGHLLALRLEETVAGAVCGVLCAYLLLSTTSRPALIASTDAYFDALDDLLDRGGALASEPDSASSLLDPVHAVESTQAEVDSTVSAMSTALLAFGRDRVDSARRLMTVASRSAVGFAQAVMAGADDPSAPGRDREILRDAVERARVATSRARQQIEPTAVPARGSATGSAPTSAEPRATGRPGSSRETSTTGPAPTSPAAPASTAATSSGTTSTGVVPPPTFDPTADIPPVGDPNVRTALVALARYTWVMNRLEEVLEPSADRPPSRLRRHAL